MKDNNFDFIKDRFDNCGVNAPESLQEEVIIDTLPEQSVQEVPKTNNKKLALGISAAAALAVVAAGAVTFTSLMPSVMKANQAGQASLRTFASREEVCQELGKAMRISRLTGARNGMLDYLPDAMVDYAEDYAAFERGSSSSGSSSSGSSNKSTYLQTEGVDEADVVKTNDRYIFYLNNESINIFTAEGKNAKRVGRLDGSRYGYINDFYVIGDRLVTLSNDWTGRAMETNGRYSAGSTAVAKVYDISNVDEIRELGSFSQSGYYVSSRMIGDTLYLVSSHHPDSENDLPFVSAAQGSTSDSATPDEVPVDDIYAVQTPSEGTFLVVSSIQTQSGAQVSKTKAILGSADTVYCSTENLYVTAQTFSPEVYRRMVDYGSSDSVGGVFSEWFGGNKYRRDEETSIIKVSLEKDIDFVASGKVSGLINNQYSLDEYNGNLRIATTSTDSNDKDVNNLFVLDKDLKQIGSVTGFARNESIKAVRYLNNTAYVITYEQTDPLFVIDVSEPSRPTILGEVKISGFSTMLVPVGDNVLLGVGYNTEDPSESSMGMEIQDGLKIVTFDVTDRANPKVLDTKVYPGFYSAVQSNPKALLYNSERNDYTIPMTHYSYGTDGEYQNRGETLNFRVGDGKITVIDEYSSEKFSGNFSDLDRCVYVGNTVYLLGTGGYNESSADGMVIIDSVDYK